MTPEEFVCKIWGLNVGEDHSDFTIPVDTAISHIENYVKGEMESNIINSIIKEFDENREKHGCSGIEQDGVDAFKLFLKSYEKKK